MTVFRGCIDLHSGVVKQIVGGTLGASPTSLVTNHTSADPPSHFAQLYRKNGITGSHVIKLGLGCDDAAMEALQAWPEGLQLGGGITAENARSWIDAGAEKVIVTSYLFPDAQYSQARLDALLSTLTIDPTEAREKLVIDLSCRRTDAGGSPSWTVAMNRWQTPTDTPVDSDTLSALAEYCSEFLVHAADVEGLCRGIDEDLVRMLGAWASEVGGGRKVPIVYAGGARSVDDLERVRELSGGTVDLAVGSALDIFGGSLIKFEDCVAWNKKVGK